MDNFVEKYYLQPEMGLEKPGNPVKQAKTADLHKSCGLVDSHQQLSHTFINSEIDGHIKDFRIFEQIHSPYY